MVKAKRADVWECGKCGKHYAAKYEAQWCCSKEDPDREKKKECSQ